MQKNVTILFFISLLFFPFITWSQISSLQGAEEFNLNNENSRVILPGIIVQNIPVTISLELTDSEMLAGKEGVELDFLVNGKLKTCMLKNGRASFSYTFSSRQEISIVAGDFLFEKEVNPIPLWMSVLPPLIAILIALIFKEVFTALFLGLLVGTSVISFYQGNSVFIALGKGILTIVDTYILQSLMDKGHLSIIVFSMLIGAMVNLITRNGGMKGVVNILSRYAKSPRSGQFITWLLGIFIFFDDYANTLVVGNTMRPVTDKLKISREKLSYIVDSTAAPIAAIAFVTTWIGAELSYIQDGINTIGLTESAYGVFIQSLGYAFYPILALLFILILVYLKRDFGPMASAETKARKGELGQTQNNTYSFAGNLSEMEIPKGIKTRWFNAVIPVVVVVFGTIIGLISTGMQEVGWETDMGFAKNISQIIGNADSYKALLWSSMAGTIVALVLTMSQRILNLKDSIDSLVKGFKTMLTAILILVLAWSIALITQHLHTAEFISKILVDFRMSPFLIPSITFILAAFVAFSTGSSWGTMAILYPLVLPSCWLLTQQFGLEYDESMRIFYIVVSSVLAGSVLGDHCSPISDTTILSSLACSCNHIEHVRTQLPYALIVGVVSIMLGTLPAAYGISPWILFPAGLLFLYIVVVVFGKKIET